MGPRRSVDPYQWSPPLRTTYDGYINTTADAIVLFEACLGGQRTHVARRPYDGEYSQLTRSGCVYIYEEHSSGIKRWTDGIPWSPSRILNNFVIYRELHAPFSQGEKKRATKKPKKANDSIVKSKSTSESSINGILTHHAAAQAAGGSTGSDLERQVYGSLIDSYDFKEDGLMKKTISINYRGAPHHLVSYYTADDLINGRLQQPMHDPTLNRLVPRVELLAFQNFRCSIEIYEVNVQHTPYSGNVPVWDINHSAWRSMSTPGAPYGTIGFPYTAPHQQQPSHDTQQAYIHDYTHMLPPQGHDYLLGVNSLPGGVAGPVNSEAVRRH